MGRPREQSPSPRTDRIIELSKRIIDHYEIDEIAKLVKVNPQTIKRWAKGEHAPVGTSLDQIPKLIAISDNTFEEYLDGQISLPEAWDRRGEADRISAKDEITFGNVLYQAKSLTPVEIKELVKSLIDCIGHSSEALEQIPVLVTLTDKQKARLVMLAKLSAAVDGITEPFKHLLECGVDPALVGDMQSGLEHDYSPDVFETLYPHLYGVNGWMDDIPLIQKSKPVKSLADMLSALDG